MGGSVVVKPSDHGRDAADLSARPQRGFTTKIGVIRGRFWLQTSLAVHQQFWLDTNLHKKCHPAVTAQVQVQVAVKRTSTKNTRHPFLVDRDWIPRFRWQAIPNHLPDQKPDASSFRNFAQKVQQQKCAETSVHPPGAGRSQQCHSQ